MGGPVPRAVGAGGAYRASGQPDPRAIRWSAERSGCPTHGPFDEVVLLLVGGVLWLCLFDLTGAERVLTTLTTITDAITWCRSADARPGDKASSGLGLPTMQSAPGHPTRHRTMEETR
jgi:hypothetical protein